jgi:hypothetical protein
MNQSAETITMIQRRNGKNLSILTPPGLGFAKRASSSRAETTGETVTQKPFKFQ